MDLIEGVHFVLRRLLEGVVMGRSGVLNEPARFVPGPESQRLGGKEAPMLFLSIGVTAMIAITVTITITVCVERRRRRSK